MNKESLSHTHTHTQEYYSAMRKKETLPFTTWMDLWASQVALVVQNPPSSAGDVRDTGSIPGSEDPLEKGMATHSSILAWRIPWTEEPGGLQSRGVTQSQTGLKQLSPVLSEIS